MPDDDSFHVQYYINQLAQRIDRHNAEAQRIAGRRKRVPVGSPDGWQLLELGLRSHQRISVVALLNELLIADGWDPPGWDVTRWRVIAVAVGADPADASTPDGRHRIVEAAMVYRLRRRVDAEAAVTSAPLRPSGKRKKKPNPGGRGKDRKPLTADEQRLIQLRDRLGIRGTVDLKKALETEEIHMTLARIKQVIERHLKRQKRLAERSK